jgi:hypothetical protein
MRLRRGSEPSADAGLSWGEALILLGGGLMLVASFLPWYEVDLILATGRLNSWQEPGRAWSMLAVMLSVALGLLVLKRGLDPHSLPELPQPPAWGRMVATWGVLPLACVTVKLIIDSDFVAYGFYAALIAGALEALGGMLVFRRQQTRSFPDY